MNRLISKKRVKKILKENKRNPYVSEGALRKLNEYFSSHLLEILVESDEIRKAEEHKRLSHKHIQLAIDVTKRHVEVV